MLSTPFGPETAELGPTPAIPPATTGDSARTSGAPPTWSPPRPHSPPFRQRLVSLLHEIWDGCWSRETWTTASLLRLASVFLVASIGSWLGIALSRQSEGVATIWLSNGIVFGLLITQPSQRWLGYFLAGLTADTLADMLYGDPFRIAIGVSLANSVEVVTSTLLLTLWFGKPLNLSNRKALIGFLFIAVVCATAITSALGASWTLLFLDAGPWLQLFRTWYLGDMLGMAIIAPLIIILQRPAFFSILHATNLPRTLLVLSAPVIATTLIFTHDKDPLIFFLFPALLLVAFRLGFPGTVLNILIVALLAIGFTVKGHGPLMLIVGDHMLLHRIVVAQIFLAVAIFTMFPVAALLEEKETLKLSLAESEARYRTLALSDELTGLSNRRSFNVQLERAWQDALANRQSLAVLLLDADLFKQFNDVHGHLNGDECLRSIARGIADILEGTSASAARFGGEEFAVILPGAVNEQAWKIAEDIRLATVARQIPHPSSPLGVQTVSLGVAALVPEAGQRAIDLVNLADGALYTAKLSGRNRVASA